MKTVALCLALFVIASSTSIMEVFKDIETTEYATSLINNIQIQLESGAHVDELTQSMRGVNNNLKQQLADGEAHHDSQRQSCQDDTAELAGGLTQAEADFGRFSGMQGLDKSTLGSRQDELGNRRREQADRVAMKAALDAQREGETDRFSALVRENEEVFGLLAQCRDIINTTFKPEDGFLQLTTTMTSQVVAKLNKFNKNVREKSVGHMYSNFFKLLATIMSKEVHTDMNIVDNIMSILDQIEENMETALRSERDAERSRGEDYEMLDNKIVGYINDTQRAVNVLLGQISNLEDRIASAAHNVDNAAQSIADYQARIADREAECSNTQMVWENFYNNITSELSTAAKIMYVLTDKHALLARYGL